MEMGRKKVKEKSIVTYKKDDLWDELLTPLEVEEQLTRVISPERRKELENIFKCMLWSGGWGKSQKIMMPGRRSWKSGGLRKERKKRIMVECIAEKQ